MNRDPSQHETGYPERRIRSVDDYVFDPSRELYVPESHAREKQTAKETKSAKPNHAFNVRVLRDWLAITISFLTLVIVAWYTYYAGGQWDAAEFTAGVAASQFRSARQALQESTKQFNITERAWLGVQDIQGSSEYDLPFITSLTFANSGKTPALNVSSLIGIADEKWNVKPSFVCAPKSSSPLVRGSTPVVIFPNEPLVFSAKTIAPRAYTLLMDEKLLHTYIYGRVTYDDIFGGKHFTNFCYELVQVGISSAGKAQYAWTPYGTCNYVESKHNPCPSE